MEYFSNATWISSFNKTKHAKQGNGISPNLLLIYIIL